jgi:predicted MPP superfamily phosphohydrolase
MIAVAIVLWSILALLAAVGVWGMFIEPDRLEVSQLTVPLPKLPASLEGLTVGHISDWHLSGGRRVFALAERSCAEIMALAPDLICVTGDVVTHMEHTAAAVTLLNRLSAPLGVFMVLGNHDCNATMDDMLYGEAPEECPDGEWRQALAGGPVVVLSNETHRVETPGGRLIVAGVGDTTAGWDDLDLTLEGAPVGELHVLLSHSPDVLDEPQSGWADLVLAGHTHGGQLVLPGLGAAWAPVWRLRHRASGLWRLNGTVAFITRGVGSGLRARINCPPEVALLRLVPGSAEALPQTWRVDLRRGKEVPVA